jgi:glycosyltransferase involved in cell wall biosynthesis
MAIPNLSGGGAERMALDLAAALDPSRFDVTTLVHERWGSLEESLDPEQRYVFEYERPYSRTHLPALFAATLRHARRADVLVGANEGRATFFMLLAGLLLRKPVVCWVHVDWSEFARMTSWRQHVSIRAYGRADRVVACSQGAADGLKALVRLPPGALRVIYNGLRADEVRRLSEAPMDPRHEPLFTGPTVVAAGRLDAQKAHEVLIAAHAHLTARGMTVNLVVLGDGPRRDELLREAERLGVADRVHLVGYQANPFPYMRRATVFALSSRFEGFPLVLAEAMLCGAPVVSTDCRSGPREMLEDGAAGLLVPVDDAESFAAALGPLLADASGRADLARHGARRAESYSLRRMATQWEDLIVGVAAERGIDVPPISTSGAGGARAGGGTRHL